MKWKAKANLAQVWTLIGIGLVAAGCPVSGGSKLAPQDGGAASAKGVPDGEGPEPGEEESEETSILDVSGVWAMSDVIDGAGCGAEEVRDGYTMEVEQVGTELTLLLPDGIYCGSVQGSRVTWSGSRRDEQAAATITLTDLEVLVAPGGDRMEGNSTWVIHSDDGSACSGLTRIQGDRVSLGGGSGGGGTIDRNITGTYDVTERIDDSDCGGDGFGYVTYSADLIQIGSSLTVCTDEGSFLGRVDGRNVEWTENHYVGEDEDTAYLSRVSLEITRSGNDVDVRGTAQWSFEGDDGERCSGRTVVSAVRRKIPVVRPGADTGPRVSIALGKKPAAAAFLLEGIDPYRPERRIRLSRPVSRFSPRAAGDAGIILGYLEFHYDAFGTLLETRQFAGSGPDGRWFTYDDEMSGCFHHLREADGTPLRLEHFGDPGTDGVWLSADDELSSSVEFLLDARGEVVEMTFFGTAGPDGWWMTADDEPSAFLTRDREDGWKRRIAPGPDGAWFTHDDHLR